MRVRSLRRPWVYRWLRVRVAITAYQTWREWRLRNVFFGFTGFKPRELRRIRFRRAIHLTPAIKGKPAPKVTGQILYSGTLTVDVQREDHR